MILFVLVASFLLSFCHAQLNNNVTWTPCDRYLTNFQCLNFSVPLDYANLSTGQAKLMVAKYPALGASQGIMFVNPGGPGGSPIDWLASEGNHLWGQMGGKWDLVAWNPRGCLGSEPNLTWFESRSEEEGFWSSIIAPGGFEAHGNLTTDADIQSFMNQSSVMDERLKALDQLFVQRNGDNLKYVGTTATVRDLVALVDAIDGPGKPVNFYGYSYGSLIASYLTQMFPDRVGKVILDGVVDPSDWTQYQPYLGSDLDIADSEAVWNGFLTICAEAGPSRCNFSQPGDTRDTLDTKVNTIIDKLYRTWNTSDAFSQNEFTETLFGYMYNPDQWGMLGQILQSIWVAVSKDNFRNGPEFNKRSLGRRRTNPLSPFSPIQRVKTFQLSKDSWNGAKREVVGPPFDGRLTMADYSAVAILCSDSADTIRASTTDVFEQMVRASKNVSRRWGGMFSPRYFCHTWSTRAVERYSGPWNKPTSNPVLVIGNQADPITPFRNAKLVASDAYLGSSARLIQRWNFGHTSASEGSICIDNLIAGYVQNGTVPADGHSDDPDLICSLNDTILGIASDSRFNTVPSQNGDALTSGPNDPGLADLHHDDSPSSASAQLNSSCTTIFVLILISFVLHW